MKRHASSAHVQIGAQLVIMEQLGKELGRKLSPSAIIIDSVAVQIDGYYEDEKEILLVECWARIGKAKVAQKHKVAADVLKLSIVAETLRIRYPQKQISCIIAFADHAASDTLMGHSWLAAAARAHNVFVRVIDIPQELIEAIKKAQIAQDLRTEKTTSATAGKL